MANWSATNRYLLEVGQIWKWTDPEGIKGFEVHQITRFTKIHQHIITKVLEKENVEGIQLFGLFENPMVTPDCLFGKPDVGWQLMKRICVDCQNYKI